MVDSNNYSADPDLNPRSKQRGGKAQGFRPHLVQRRIRRLKIFLSVAILLSCVNIGYKKDIGKDFIAAITTKFMQDNVVIISPTKTVSAPVSVSYPATPTISKATPISNDARGVIPNAVHITYGEQ